MYKSIFLTISLVIGLSNTLFAEEPQPRIISTAGEATIYVVPDEATIICGVRSTNPSLDSAKQDNDERSAMLVKAIKSQGIEDRYVATDNMSVSLSFRNNDQIIETYHISRTYMITVKDVKKIESLVNLILKSGANVFEGVNFRTSELRKYRDQARSMAIKAAKEKAVALARDLDCTVGSPRSISESGGGGIYYGFRGANMSQNAVQEMPAGGDGGEVLPLGQIAVRADVSVTFDLAPPAK